jgi:hypothetical protein
VPDNNPAAIAEQPAEQLSVGRLYVQLAASRAATIEGFLRQTSDAPEPLAETLTLAAAGLAHVSGAPGATIVETALAAAVARRLTAEAHSHDVRAGAFAERALAELETAPLDRAELIGETAESLIWAAAALRREGARLETAEEGNADQLELAWLCLLQAADVLMAADRASIEVRRAMS